MKVSIITATYNSANTIIDSLNSLIAQDYSNIEYIVVDGASTDNTLALIKEYYPNAKIISEPDKGIYDALNKGIKAATGDVIGFLHSDDIFAYSSAITDLVAVMKNENKKAVYADLDYISKDNSEKTIRHWVSGTYSKEKLKQGWMPPHPTFYMERSLYEKFGGFDLSFSISADYESLLRYLWVNDTPMGYLPKTVMKMRVGGKSNRNLKNILIKSKEDRQALKNNDIPWLKALLLKNLSKIPQFCMR